MRAHKLWLAVVGSTVLSVYSLGAAPAARAETLTPSPANIVLACTTTALVACVEQQVNSLYNGATVPAGPVVCPNMPPGNTTCAGGPANGGYSGPDQLLGATESMLLEYRNRVVQTHERVMPAYTSVATNTESATTGAAVGTDSASLAYNASYCSNSANDCPPSSASVYEDGTVELDGYCGPASAAGVLYALDLQRQHYSQTDIAAKMAYPNSYDSSQGVGRGSWKPYDSSDGSGGYWYGVDAINYYSETTAIDHYYVWDDVGNGNDVWYYTVDDIANNGTAPIYNIQDAIDNGSDYRSWTYPLSWYTADYWPGHYIRHYFPAYGYYGNEVIQIFDDNNYQPNNHFDVVSAGDLFTAIAAVPNTPQVLW